VGLALTLALPLAAPLSCRKAQDPAPAVTRLVEATAGVEVDWPDVAGTPMPPDLDPVELGALPYPGRLARVRLVPRPGEHDTRVAIVAPAGSRHRFKLRLPETPRLRVALGTIPEAEGATGSVGFVVTVRRGSSEPDTVLDETVPVAATGPWRDREVALDRWAGKEVTIELATTGATTGAPPAPAPVHFGAWANPEVVAASTPPDGYHLVLISLDTLRADHLGCYGYHRPTSPRIDEFARRSLVFAHTVSQSPWTRPSHRALFTGLYPASNQGLVSPPLAAMLWRAGYRTTALTGGGQVDHPFGFSTGFETFRVVDWMRSAAETGEWLDQGGGRKSFLFLHSYEVHDPYEGRDFVAGLDPGRIGPSFSKRQWERFKKKAITPAERSYIEALYDGDIAVADRGVGSFLAELERRGLLERTIVILTADHGEQFWEHGSWRHGQTMYDHQLMVPLIVHLPEPLRRSLAAAGGGGATPSRVDDIVRLVDVYPTLLDLLGVPRTHPVQGRSLRPLLAGLSMPEVDAFAENTNIGPEKKALRSRQFKFVYSFPRGQEPGDRTGETFEIYDLVADPGEHTDLSAERQDLVAALTARVDDIRQGRPGAALDEELPSNVSPELREKLEALGYVGQ
jgi:arylsulfatase A-like enzyme